MDKGWTSCGLIGIDILQATEKVSPRFFSTMTAESGITVGRELSAKNDLKKIK